MYNPNLDKEEILWLSERVNRMTKDERSKFFYNLKRDIIKINKKIDRLNKNQEKLQNRNTERYVGTLEEGAIWIVNALASALVCGFIAKDLSPEIRNIIALSGAAVISPFTTNLTAKLYETKPISNKFALKKAISNENNLKKLNEQKYVYETFLEKENEETKEIKNEK